jgi:uncharacterized protein (DUF1015 family)
MRILLYYNLLQERKSSLGFHLFYGINDDKKVNQEDFHFLSFNIFLLTDVSRNKLPVFDQNQVINLMIQFHYKLSLLQINEERQIHPSLP